MSVHVCAVRALMCLCGQVGGRECVCVLISKRASVCVCVTLFHSYLI